MLSRTTTTRAAAVLGLGALVLLFASPSTARGGGDSEDLLRSGVAASLTTDGPVLFENRATGNPGVAPGGAPWVTDPGDIRVDDEGDLRADIHGLVIPPPTQPNFNPLDFIGASLVCNGMIVDTTAPFPFSDDGDAEIRETVTVPDNCLAPAVLLHPATANSVTIARYIAASGG